MKSTKVMLILKEMPETCYYCPCYGEDSASQFCQVSGKELKSTSRPEWCPLKYFPKKKEKDWGLWNATFRTDRYENGWNACIDELEDD